MRVLLVNKRYPPWIGGVEAHVALLARELARRPEISLVQVLAVSPDRRLQVFNRDGVRVVLVPQVGTLYGMPIGRGIVEHLRAAPVDLVHLQMPFPQGEWALTRIRRPRVVTYQAEVVRQRLVLPLYRLFLRSFIRRTDGVVVTSPQLAAHALIGTAGCVEMIPLGIDLEPFQATASLAQERRRLQAEYGDACVLFVGRFVGYKGLEYLLDAMVDVDAPLLLVGDGPLRGALARHARRHAIAHRVHFLGVVPDHTLAACYHACALLVLPSVGVNEAYGLVQLEAHACGRPVVSTALPTGVPFVNQDGVTGLVVPPRDSRALASAIRRLLGDPVLRARLGRQAQERVRREFSKDVMVERHIRLYREVLRRSS